MAEHYDEPPGGWELFDKPRAKPVSKDKGEAISLELVENLKYGGMHIRKWENLSNLGAGTHKLYTHPADQVVDGVVVSRELLEQCVDLLSTAQIFDLCTIRTLTAQKDVLRSQLRALLAKP